MTIRHRTGGDKYQKSDQMDAKSIQAYVNDPKSWNPIYLWHAPGVPTFAGAVLLAKESKLTTFDQSKVVIKQSNNGTFRAIVTVINGSSSRGGAGSHTDSIVARGFAYRNAVRQMVLSVGGAK